MISVSHCSQRNRVPAAVGMLARIPNQRGQSGESEGPRGSGSVRRVAATSDDPQRWSVEHDGLTIGALDWGGDGPPLVLLHPNGFCAGVFEPLARLAPRRLPDHRDRPPGPRHQRRAVDRPRRAVSYAAAGDVVAMLDELGLDEVVLLGESLGGGTGILVDRLRPGLVRQTAAVRADRDAVGRGIARRRDGENHMSAMARRRRAVWADRATVLRVVREPSAAEHDGARGARRLRALGVPRPARRAGRAVVPARGRGVVLRVRHASRWRARVVRAPRVAALRRHHRVLPTGPTCPAACSRRRRERAGVDLVIVAGTHFFVQENTARAAALVREHLVW